MTTYTYFDPEDPSTHPSPDQDGLPYLVVGVDEGESMQIDHIAVGFWDSESVDFGIALGDGFVTHAREHFHDPDFDDINLYYTPITDPRQS